MIHNIKGNECFFPSCSGENRSMLSIVPSHDDERAARNGNRKARKGGERDRNSTIATK